MTLSHRSKFSGFLFNFDREMSETWKVSQYCYHRGRFTRPAILMDAQDDEPVSHENVRRL
jgi:hypothetical protein